MKNIFMLLLATVFSIYTCFSQTLKFSDFKNELESYFQNVSDINNIEPIIDKIEYYKMKPILLRYCKSSSLTELPGINLNEANAIISLVDATPNATLKFISDSLKFSRIQSIILGLCTSMQSRDSINNNAYYIRYRSSGVSQIQEEKGLRDSKFAGNGLDINQKIYAGYGDYSTGVILSKNPGEKSITDFLSFHAQLKSDKYQLIIGDFTGAAGFGSILMDAFGARKGGEGFGSPLDYGIGVSPNKSTIDYFFFRGFSCAYNYEITKRSGINTVLFYSNVNRPGGIDSTGAQTSIYTSGLYRTQTEIDKKNANNEKALGATIEYYNDKLSFGFNMINLNYEKPIISNSAGVFSGKSGSLFSLFAMYRTSGTSLGFEISQDAHGNTSYIGTGNLYDEYFDFTTRYRYYSKNFRSPFGSNFGEFSNPANEVGLYSAFTIKSVKNALISLYFDIYRSITRTTMIQAPVKGFDLSIDWRQKMDDKIYLNVKLKNEARTDAITNDSLKKQNIYEKSRLSSRIETIYMPTSILSIKQRLDIAQIGFENLKPDEYGALVSIDIDYDINDYFTIGFNTSIYSTDSFESTIWRYEYFMPGKMSIQAFSGKGSKSNFYIKYSPLKELDLYLLYSDSGKNSVKTLGSSYDEITGNRLNRIYMQIDYNLGKF